MAKSVTSDAAVVAEEDALDTLRGVPVGAEVLTLDGPLPVEYLTPGDKIITRDGLQVLRSVVVRKVCGPLMRVEAGAIGEARPFRTVLMPLGTRVLLRDWRAKVFAGSARALVDVSRLEDGEFIAREWADGLAVFELCFDAACVIYVDGADIEAGARVTEDA